MAMAMADADADAIDAMAVYGQHFLFFERGFAIGRWQQVVYFCFCAHIFGPDTIRLQKKIPRIFSDLNSVR